MIKIYYHDKLAFLRSADYVRLFERFTEEYVRWSNKALKREK